MFGPTDDKRAKEHKRESQVENKNPRWCRARGEQGAAASEWCSLYNPDKHAHKELEM